MKLKFILFFYFVTVTWYLNSSFEISPNSYWVYALLNLSIFFTLSTWSAWSNFNFWMFLLICYISYFTYGIFFCLPCCILSFDFLFLFFLNYFIINNHLCFQIKIIISLSFILMIIFYIFPLINVKRIIKKKKTEGFN